jgi:hypothetical protein
MAKSTDTKTKVTPNWPANYYGIYNSEPFARIKLGVFDKALLREKLQLKQVQSLLAEHKRKNLQSPEQLKNIRGLSKTAIQRLQHRLLLDDDRGIYIDDVTAEDSYVFSDRPFRLKVQFSNWGEGGVAVASLSSCHSA